MQLPPLRLKKDQERRLLTGHCWVYSNEIDIEATPLRAFEGGDVAELFGHGGHWIGYAYVNPHSLIAARLVSRRRGRPPTPALWVERIARALELRQRLYPKPFYRLIFGEADGLPGLTVDRYGSSLVAQLTTAGMERAKADLIAALEQVVRPETVLLRNDAPVRAMEGLGEYVETVVGSVPETAEVEENGARFRVSLTGGQKTGWFFDQAENRSRLGRYGVRGRVLDLFSYVGAWGIQAALGGAEDVLCVDASAAALERVTQNAALNGVGDRVRTSQGDAFTVLKQLADTGERFDTVILDPPAFIKRRKDVAEGSQAYQRLNRMGIGLLTEGGLLVTSSCSFHMERDVFLRTVQRASRRSGFSLQLLEVGGQGPDHPIHPAIAETAYLKTLFLRATPAF